MPTAAAERALLCPGVWSSDAAASSADVTQLTAAEHGTTLVTQSLVEQAKQRAAGQAGQAASEAASPLPVLPAYEAEGGLNRRAQGWLKHLHRKATTPDDWSSSGIPNAWWDRYSGPPMTNFPRFDLQESAYAMALMADRTPAWREVYAEVLDGLLDR